MPSTSVDPDPLPIEDEGMSAVSSLLVQPSVTGTVFALAVLSGAAVVLPGDLFMLVRMSMVSSALGCLRLEHTRFCAWAHGQLRSVQVPALF